MKPQEVVIVRNFDNVENVLYDALHDMWFAVVRPQLERASSAELVYDKIKNKELLDDADLLILQNTELFDDEPTSNVWISREDAKAWFELKIANHEDGILRARSALALFDMREK